MGEVDHNKQMQTRKVTSPFYNRTAGILLCPKHFDGHHVINCCTLLSFHSTSISQNSNYNTWLHQIQLQCILLFQSNLSYF